MVANQAIPTSLLVGQPDMRCQRPAPSSPFCPRHEEKSESRSLSVTVLQSTFHGVAGSAWVGQLISRCQRLVGSSMYVQYIRWVMDLKLDDSKGDVEHVLITAG